MKPKSCKVCHEKFQPTRSIQPCCSYECEVKLANSHVNRAETTRKRLERKETREAKERIKPRSKWLAETQKEFNRFIRLRDEQLPCISCGRYHQGQWHAGHFRTVGSCPELRFNELNCHKQCAPCNNHLSGNILAYRHVLIERIGLEKVEWLEGHHEPKKYTIEELKEIKEKYSKLAKELEKSE